MSDDSTILGPGDPSADLPGSVRTAAKARGIDLPAEIRVPCPSCDEGTVPLPAIYRRVLDVLTDEPQTTPEIAKRVPIGGVWQRESILARLEKLRGYGLAKRAGRRNKAVQWVRADTKEST